MDVLQIVLETDRQTLYFSVLHTEDLEAMISHMTASLKRIFPDSSPGWVRLAVGSYQSQSQWLLKSQKTLYVYYIQCVFLKILPKFTYSLMNTGNNHRLYIKDVATTMSSAGFQRPVVAQSELVHLWDLSFLKSDLTHGRSVQLY